MRELGQGRVLDRESSPGPSVCPQAPLTLSSLASISTTSVSTSSIVALRQGQGGWRPACSEPPPLTQLGLVSQAPPQRGQQWEGATLPTVTGSCRPTCLHTPLRQTRRWRVAVRGDGRGRGRGGRTGTVTPEPQSHQGPLPPQAHRGPVGCDAPIWSLWTGGVWGGRGWSDRSLAQRERPGSRGGAHAGPRWSPPRPSPCTSPGLRVDPEPHLDPPPPPLSFCCSPPRPGAGRPRVRPVSAALRPRETPAEACPYLLPAPQAQNTR